MATRQEHALKNSRKIADRTEKKILNCITGMFKDDYKKKMVLGILQKLLKIVELQDQQL